MTACILGAVMMYIFRLGSRNSVNEERDHAEFRSNYQSLVGVKLPHMDTVDAILENLPCSMLEELQQQLVRILLNKRVLSKFKFMEKYHLVAIDGTGLFTFEDSPYAGCPNKKSKNGVISYQQNIVEAKLICSNGFSISLASEIILNDDGSSKQDCEYNATVRLLNKLKRAFPRMDFCIVMDGLYTKYNMQKQIVDKHWKFIMVWKSKTLYALQDEIAKRKEQGLIIYENKCKVINDHQRVETDFEYDSIPLKNNELDIYYIQGIETHIDIKKNQKVATTFVFMTNVAITQGNYKEVFQAGRLRWKIENEGFNTQKNGGYALHHKMNRKNINAIKNYYLCLQIAHLFCQLLELCKNSQSQIYECKKKMWEYFLSFIRTAEVLVFSNQPQKINLRY